MSHIATQFPGIDTFNQQWIDAHTRHNGITGIINFIGVSVLLLSIGLPRQLVAFMGGYAFGVAQGLIYSTLAATVSCLVVMCIARYFAKPLIQRYFSGKMTKINRFLAQDAFIKSIFVRLLPVGNNLLTNLLVGVTNVKVMPFIAGSTIGYVPQMLIFAVMGKGLLINDSANLVISVVLLGLTSVLGGYILQKYRYQFSSKPNDPTEMNVKMGA
ncbi:TVP38/TMEM64 family protein [Paraglaciecola mesophila]|uniref:TVP38/TMEM64 family protein n=1 Tax=Paraglaciecola mesophila TaxID=197222 RepID=UPI0020C77502|nr:VTT domain-containing protein [Paraglaciecola mesophila]